MMVVEPGLQVQGLLCLLSSYIICTMPQMAPAYGAHTLGDLEARTANNQMTFLPIELMLLKEWKFGSVGGGERLGCGGSSGCGCWGS